MATSCHLQGYQCQFIDSIPEDFYCKKCSKVARRLAIISCCGESYCHACVAVIQEEGKPCLMCGKKEFTFLDHVKTQRRISNLQVYCSMKERGCDWSGTLEQLDTHLDPHQDNCQYVDIKCPLNCDVAVPKNKVEQHVAQHCAKRPYVCQYCNFKATYEEVVEKHIAECKYVPLQCPNLCGVTFERVFLEDHMKMCRLEEVGCKFSGVGCEDRFSREVQEEHTRQNSQKHLTLTASLAMETKEQLQLKLLEQDKKHKEEVEKLKEKIKDQEKELNEQKMEILKQEKHLEEQKVEHLRESQQIKDQFTVQQKEIQALQTKLSELSDFLGFNRTITMTNFSKAKKESAVWDSPAMYTHIRGYKFFLRVYPNGRGGGRGKALCAELLSTPGDFDEILKWPTPKFNFKLEVINQHGGENLVLSSTYNYWNSTGEQLITSFGPALSGWLHVCRHSELHKYLKDDTIVFRVDVVIV